MTAPVGAKESEHCSQLEKIENTFHMIVGNNEDTDNETVHLKNNSLKQYVCEVCGKEFCSNLQYKKHKNHFIAKHKYFICCSKIKECENNFNCRKIPSKNDIIKNNQMQLKTTTVTNNKQTETNNDSKGDFICEAGDIVDDDHDHERVNFGDFDNYNDNGDVGDGNDDEDDDSVDDYDDDNNSICGEIKSKDEIFNKTFTKNKKFKKKSVAHGDIKYKIYKCQECLQLFTKYSNLSQHSKIIHHKQGKFKCSVCYEDFNTSEEIKFHMEMHGPEDKIVCKGCKKTFDTLKLYYNHARQNPGMHCFMCKLCLRKFPTELLLDQHVCIWQNGKPLYCACGREFTKYKDVIDHSKGTKPFSCCSCPHLANSLTAYIRHLRKHSKQKPYHCIKCNMKFAVIEFLNIHNKKFHSESESEFLEELNSDSNQLAQHVCSLCNHKFNTEEELKKHNIKIHEQKSAPENERIQCPDCGKFLKRYRLEYHRNITHKTSARLCPECGKLFDTRFKLTQHILTAHNNEPVKCEVCMKVLKTKKILNEHMKTHLKSELGGRIPQAICPMCGLGLAQKGSLARHILLTHERHKIVPCHKTYTCQECSAVLPNRAKYYSHRRMHRAMTDRFPCEVCGREFNKKQNLKRHMYLLHDESRVIPDPIFKCQFCKRSFREKKNRKRHYLMVHKFEDIF